MWEKKADNRLYPIGYDTLFEKRFNKGKQSAWLLKKAQTETVPPPSDCIYHFGKKDWADYIRINEDYIPLSREYQSEITEHYTKQVRRNIWDLRKKTPEEVYNKYIYVPVNYSLVQNVQYKPMDYDVNMMRMNAIDNREKIYADRLSFWANYGHYLILGGVIVLVIVVVYMSYDYGKNIIDAGTQTFDTATTKLVTAIQNIGGPPPAS